MEARNVNLYYKPINEKNINGRFYDFYVDSANIVDISGFLNAISEIKEIEQRVDNISNLTSSELINDIKNTIQKTFKIKSLYNEGISKEYNVVLTFTNIRDGKNYLIYTENRYDKNNLLIMMALIYDEDLPEPFESYPSSKESWNDIITLTDSLLLINDID
jgi:uncharacterized protein YrzB (UPF0473 family)